MRKKWQLPRPVAFVLSGGAALGAIQAGMLRALHDADLQPDLLVGTSVGALNGAIIADRGLEVGVDVLEALWSRLRREDVFPGGKLSQTRHFLLHRNSIFPNGQLARLACQVLRSETFEELQLPFGALATDLLTSHGALFAAGRLHLPLLASSAIPGIYPPVEINGRPYGDGALTAHVPLSAAITLGARSLVVLDAGELCHREVAPKNIVDMIGFTLQSTMRQRIRVETAAVAETHSLLYLPTPCTTGKSSAGFLDFSRSADLMAAAESLAAGFLADAPPPTPGRMSGAPHYHHATPATSTTQILTAYAE